MVQPNAQGVLTAHCVYLMLLYKQVLDSGSGMPSKAHVKSSIPHPETLLEVEEILRRA